MRWLVAKSWSRATHDADLRPIGEKRRLLVILLYSLGVELYSSGPILVLKGIIALVLEFYCISRRHGCCDVDYLGLCEVGRGRALDFPE